MRIQSSFVVFAFEVSFKSEHVEKKFRLCKTEIFLC